MSIGVLLSEMHSFARSRLEFPNTVAASLPYINGHYLPMLLLVIRVLIHMSFVTKMNQTKKHK
jgi:hypothetical protein